MLLNSRKFFHTFEEYFHNTIIYLIGKRDRLKRCQIGILRWTAIFLSGRVEFNACLFRTQSTYFYDKTPDSYVLILSILTFFM